MDDLKSKVAYLNGLANGLNISEDTKEGKLLLKIIEVLGHLSDAVAELQDDYEDLMEYAEAIDNDLTDLEEDYYDEFDEEDGDDDDTLEDEEGNYFTIECPDCHEVICMDEELLEEDDTLEILCPKCEKVVFVNDDHWDEEVLEREKNND
jgi:NAD-dependent SIR2 family protein deacetylase